MKIIRPMYGMGVLSMLVACASSPLPREQLAAAQSAIDHAQNAGASQYASHELARARDRLEQARNAVLLNETERARRFAAEAEIAATLALVRTGTAKSSRAVEELDRSIRALRQEIDERARRMAPLPARDKL
ncbi:MAG: DUF4398 domain-containing protein [Paludibacterium sp.]|uniref:DUF4398 domain-containing protein n=1 Tax=Paludibacterium sp. TaxID=1917523 RepID=UPI0025D9E002|nr:DUF4398 domain-containing protein [Paludibacterium sp.]MBV8047598.1 DUF4398 domain-containing protein [Paludibacterium sp.]MBV8648216.1 DUF4398 domain-containing protein [Paludibacterium sp.]